MHLCIYKTSLASKIKEDITHQSLQKCSRVPSLNCHQLTPGLVSHVHCHRDKGNQILYVTKIATNNKIVGFDITPESLLTLCLTSFDILTHFRNSREEFLLDTINDKRSQSHHF